MLTVSVNSFTVLEYDVPAPSVPTVAEFTFNYPPPSRSEPQVVRHFSTTPLPLSLAPHHLSALTVSSEQGESWKNGECYKFISDLNGGTSVRPRAWSPGLPSTPNSPPILPRGLLPVDSGCKTSSVPNLDDVRIPSPLLYHDKGQDIFASSEDTIRDELFSAFLMTGRSSQAEIVEHNEMVISAAFKNVPQPPWIMPSKLATPITTPTDEVRLMLEPPTSVLAPNDNDTGLIFPILEATAAAFPDSQPQPTADLHYSDSVFIEDDPQKMERMWDAFEAVIGSPRDPDRISSWSFSTGAGTETDLSDEGPTTDAATPVAVDIEARSTPACTALVPARLYHHPYSGWPQWHVQEYREPLFSFIGAIPQSMPTSSIPNKWCEDAGFEDRHVQACQNDAGQVASLACETFDAIADDVQGRQSGIDLQIQHPISSESSSHENDSIIEHDSAYESASEISLEDAMWSDDEWADLNWDEDEAWMFEDASTEQSDDKTAWDEVHQRLA